MIPIFVYEFGGQTEVNQFDLVKWRGTIEMISDHNIFKLKVVVHETSLMDALELLNYLYSDLANSLKRKWLPSLVKVIIKSFTKFLHYNERVTLVLNPSNFILILIRIEDWQFHNELASLNQFWEQVMALILDFLENLELISTHLQIGGYFDTNLSVFLIRVNSCKNSSKEPWRFYFIDNNIPLEQAEIQVRVVLRSS